jgi:hypothetical protein
MQMSVPTRQILARLGAAVFGGYLFTWGFVTLGIAGFVAAEQSYQEAKILLYLLAFLVFGGAMLWAFAARSVWKVWAVLGGAGIVMTLSAWVLSRTMH